MKKEIWDKHWHKINKKSIFFGRFLEAYRKFLIANAVQYYFEKYFPKQGIFVEMGSGTSQTSCKIIKHKRILIALDISEHALTEAKKIPQINKIIQADIFKTPFKNNSINGIWNLGVMEHFNERDIIKILNEFHRVLKKDSYVILFWPPIYGSSEVVLGFFEKIVNLFKKNKFHFFPGEITRLISRKHAKKLISKSKLKFLNAYFNYKDNFTHVVVVCKKM